jgi:hypothetical protein
MATPCPPCYARVVSPAGDPALRSWPVALALPAFMSVPSLACPAECRQCFGPHQGAFMSPEVADDSIEFITRVAAEKTQARKVTGADAAQARYP